MSNTDALIDLERSKANFTWWYQNRFSKKPNEHVQQKMKCICGHKFVSVKQTAVRAESVYVLWDHLNEVYRPAFVPIPERHLIRYVDFENMTADLCFSCGRNLELVANLIQEQKELRKERNKLTKRLKEINFKLNKQI